MVFSVILNSSQQAKPRFRDIILFKRFCPDGFRRAFFNYHSGLWLPLSHIILSKTCSKLRNDSIKVDNHLENVDFTDLVKDASSSQLQVLLLPANYFESDRMTSRKHSLAAKTFSKWRSPKSIFQEKFLQDNGTVEAETSKTGKA